MELQLDRKLANKRIYPAIDITSSSTRRDDLLMDKDVQNKMWLIRNHIADMNTDEAMHFLLHAVLEHASAGCHASLGCSHAEDGSNEVQMPVVMKDVGDA